MRAYSVGRGIPFLVEKPLAAADGAVPPRIAEAIDRAGLVVAVGYHWRGLDFLPEVRATVSWIGGSSWSSGAGSTTRPARTGGAEVDQGGGQVVEQATHL